ncbi:hypothetical protein CFOL_v3_21659 [Cephalotus follicularis]|uniref:Uncharacterized protein n=1 Tax=Cephalotus follicularis TaxID=3775 RepID=A0A1Q3CDN7_CEPFO|nr:hypothetical protein CFOL_v3_21659 [Cephalotus follicularis]
MARTTLCENALPKYFWADAVNTACYVLNRITIRPILKNTPYELWRERKPNISYFRAFGCKFLYITTARTTSVSSTQKPTNVYFLDTQTLVRLIEFLIRKD